MAYSPKKILAFQILFSLFYPIIVCLLVNPRILLLEIENSKDFLYMCMSYVIPLIINIVFCHLLNYKEYADIAQRTFILPFILTIIYGIGGTPHSKNTIEEVIWVYVIGYWYYAYCILEAEEYKKIIKKK